MKPTPGFFVILLKSVVTTSIELLKYLFHIYRVARFSNERKKRNEVFVSWNLIH